MKQNRKTVISAAMGFILLGMTMCGVSFLTGALAEEGAVKESVYYIVRQGDCLWTISDRFYEDPFLWPFVWQNNPWISNPHWIYPGDRILLSSLDRQLAREPVGSGQRAGPPADLPSSPEPAVKTLVVPRALADMALIGESDLEPAGWVLQSLDGRMLLAQGDELYLEMRDDQQISAGETFQILRKVREVRHPKTGKRMGSLVRLMGFVRTTAPSDSGIASARVVLSNGGIEKGDMVAKEFIVPPSRFVSKPSSRAISGCVVSSLGDTYGIAQYDVCFIDKGLADGVEVGDAFWVMRPSEEVKGFGERGKIHLPDNRIGTMVVLLAEKNSATALVTETETTFAPGYPVVSRTE